MADNLEENINKEKQIKTLLLRW